jgi:uncharacterized repeat protein (TIGR01451 family)
MQSFLKYFRVVFPMSSTRKTTALKRSKRITSSFLSLTSLLLNPIFFRYSLIVSTVMLGLTAQIEQAQAVVPITWSFNGTGVGTLSSTSTIATTTLPNGTVVTATISGMTWYNSAPETFTGAGLASFPPSTPNQALGILVPAGCSTTTACGTITLTFSKPVSSPKFYVSDLGGNASLSGILTGFRFAPVSITSGQTFSAIGQGTNTQLINGNKTITLITANNVGKAIDSNSCGTEFGCGSYNIVGTEPYSSLALQIDPLQKFGAAVPADVVLLTLDVVESVQISGTVFDDADGSKVKNGTEAGTNGGGLNAVLVNSSNQVVATTAVAANGTYTFSNITANATYTVQITTATATVGSAPPAIALPSNWVSTGENLNNVADSTVDSILTVPVTASNITTANFGIKQNPADVLLLKRITAINGLSTNPNDNTTSLTGVLVDPNWKAGYVVGAIDGGPVKPGDTIEYTIYYLNNGGRNAKSARICDRLNANQTFQPNTYTTGAGMQVQIGGDRITNTALTLTNQSGDDGGQFIAATSPVTALPTNCNSVTGAPNNDYGALILDLVTNPGSPNLTALPGSTGQGTPNDSFGFWRFTTKVNQVSP